MEIPQIVIDTNVLLAGLKSTRGYSFKLLQRVGTGSFTINLSVPLVIEYESTLKKLIPDQHQLIEFVINYHCLVARRHKIYYLWRPFLKDPKDDMILELAVRSQCDYIVTYNMRDFEGIETFGIQAVKPGDFLVKKDMNYEHAKTELTGIAP